MSHWLLKAHDHPSDPLLNTSCPKSCSRPMVSLQTHYSTLHVRNPAQGPWSASRPIAQHSMSHWLLKAHVQFQGSWWVSFLSGNNFRVYSKDGTRPTWDSRWVPRWDSTAESVKWDLSNGTNTWTDPTWDMEQTNGDRWMEFDEWKLRRTEQLYWAAPYSKMGVRAETPVTTKMGPVDGKKMGKKMGETEMGEKWEKRWDQHGENFGLKLILKNF